VLIVNTTYYFVIDYKPFLSAENSEFIYIYIYIILTLLKKENTKYLCDSVYSYVQHREVLIIATQPNTHLKKYLICVFTYRSEESKQQVIMEQFKLLHIVSFCLFYEHCLNV